MRLDGKVALVTGATYGIGTTILERLAEEGASVAFTGRSGDKGKSLEARLRADGRSVLFVQGSVTEEDEVRSAVAATVDRYGSLTTVVNNAAATDISRPGGGDSHVDVIDTEVFEQ